MKHEPHRMNTTTCIRQIAVVVVNCDLAGLSRALHHGHKHRPENYQKRQQPNKFFHGSHRRSLREKAAGWQVRSPLLEIALCSCVSMTLPTSFAIWPRQFVE